MWFQGLKENSNNQQFKVGLVYIKLFEFFKTIIMDSNLFFNLKKILVKALEFVYLTFSCWIFI
jgi:hypothetical protein